MLLTSSALTRFPLHCDISFLSWFPYRCLKLHAIHTLYQYKNSCIEFAISCICLSVHHKSRFRESQKPHKSRPLHTPKTTQIKNFASPALAAMYATHQAKCFINAPAVHRPEPVWAGQHVPAEDVGFAHSPAADADGVSEDMNG